MLSKNFLWVGTGAKGLSVAQAAFIMDNDDGEEYDGLELNFSCKFVRTERVVVDCLYADDYDDYAYASYDGVCRSFPDIVVWDDDDNISF